MDKAKSKTEKIVKSINKSVRSSTRKLKPILRSIIGKKVDIAVRDLTFSDKRISNDVKKTLSSAGALADVMELTHDTVNNEYVLSVKASAIAAA